MVVAAWVLSSYGVRVCSMRGRRSFLSRGEKAGEGFVSGVEFEVGKLESGFGGAEIAASLKG